MKKGKPRIGQKIINQVMNEWAKTEERMEPHNKEDGGCWLPSHGKALAEAGGDCVILCEIAEVSKEPGSFKDKVQESLS